MLNHLARGEITHVEQIGWDRILKITINPFVEILKGAPKSLIVELMGKHSNIVLVEEDSQHILESIKHIDDTMSRFRVVLPGEVYQLPPQQEKLDPIQLDYSFKNTIGDPRQSHGYSLQFRECDWR